MIRRKSDVIQWVILLPFLAACAQTYWAFPPGKTLADFRRDEQGCVPTGWALEVCLIRKGYRQITEAQYIALQQQALALASAKPTMDIVAYDVRTGEIFIGKSEFVPGATTSSITVKGLVSKIECSGASDIVKVTPQGKGSLGEATMLCRDGRSVKAKFVYDTRRSGWGSGQDNNGNEFRFIFGDLDLDHDKLRRKFEEMFEKEKTKPHDLGA